MIQFADHLRALDELKMKDRYRFLIPRAGHDFSSNDYLGLAGSETMRKAAQDALERNVSVGSGGSRLLRGNTSEHELLEAEAAAFFETQRALFLSNGFAANTAIFSRLPMKGDLIVYDSLVHASVHDGMRLGPAKSIAFDHNDIMHAETQIKGWRAKGGTGQVWLAFESVYSMDGDFAPAHDLVALANRHHAIVVVDEAHATGVYGSLGRGLLHPFAGQPNILSLHTCGKGLGVSGALICGSETLIETLINKARGFIYSTAPSPLTAALVRAALKELKKSPSRQVALKHLIAHAHSLALEKCYLSGLQSQIIPIIIGNEKQTMAMASRLQESGFDIRGIRPPSVPPGTSRLRISITLNTSTDVVSRLFDVLAEGVD